MNYRLALQKFTELYEEIRNYQPSNFLGLVHPDTFEDYYRRCITYIELFYGTNSKHLQEAANTTIDEVVYTRIQKLKMYIKSTILTELEAQVQIEYESQKQNQIQNELELRGRTILTLQEEIGILKTKNEENVYNIQELNKQVEHEKSLQNSYAKQTKGNSNILEKLKTENERLEKEAKRLNEKVKFLTEKPNYILAKKEFEKLIKNLDQRFGFFSKEDYIVPKGEINNHHDRTRILIENTFGEHSDQLHQFDNLIKMYAHESGVEKIVRLIGFLRSNILQQVTLLVGIPDDPRPSKTISDHTYKILFFVLLFLSTTAVNWYFSFTIDRTTFGLIEAGLILSLLILFFKKVPEYISLIIQIALALAAIIYSRNNQ